MVKSQLHPGAKWSFRIGIYFLFLFLGIFFFSWVAVPIFALFLKIMGFGVGAVLVSVLALILLYLVVVIVVGEVYATMAYNRWFYEFGDSQLKVEKGVIWKTYSNIPYERVQNVDVRRGIIARLLGFSEVHIQTAGFSAPGTEGSIPAVSIEDAEKIREFLMKKITKRGRNQGL